MNMNYMNLSLAWMGALNMALALSGCTNGIETGLSAPEGVTVRHLTLGGDRERIRTLSAHHAFDMLRRYLTNLPTEGE